MAVFRRGKPRVLSPEAREGMAAAKRGDANPAKRPEVGAKISAAHKASGRFRRERNPRWKGGQWMERGYVVMNTEIGERKRSHVIWEQAHPDDPIQPGDVIHHMNHVKNDDRLENLMKISQSEHAHEHDFGSLGRRYFTPEERARPKRRRS